MKRAEVLDKAKEMVTGQRQMSYGSPEQNFMAIASLWGAYLMNKRSVIVEARDVAAMMILLKVARICTAGRAVTDSWIDAAGYAACGAEVEEIINTVEVKVSESGKNIT